MAVGEKIQKWKTLFCPQNYTPQNKEGTHNHTQWKK